MHERCLRKQDVVQRAERNQIAKQRCSLQRIREARLRSRLRLRWKMTRTSCWMTGHWTADSLMVIIITHQFQLVGLLCALINLNRALVMNFVSQTNNWIQIYCIFLPQGVVKLDVNKIAYGVLYSVLIFWILIHIVCIQLCTELTI